MRKHMIGLLLAVLGQPLSAGQTQTGALPGFSERMQARAEQVGKAAGEPVGSVRFRVFDGFEPLGTESLLLLERGGRGYLLTVTPCWDLPWAMVIGGIRDYEMIWPGLNAVQTAKSRCVIRAIRPVDMKALKAADTREPTAGR